jgi:hypothetical protein
MAAAHRMALARANDFMEISGAMPDHQASEGSTDCQANLTGRYATKIAGVKQA